MSTQKFLKPTKLILDPKTQTKDTCRRRDHVDNSAPPTPRKPTDKKAKSSNECEVAEVTNKTILQAILNLEKRVDEQLAELSIQAKQSSAMIASLAKAVQFNAEEVKECKQKLKHLEKTK